MTVLLKDALMPNLVQTLENNPAFIHGGPFANIAHGCNSVIATQTALQARRLRRHRGGLRRRSRRREVLRHQVPQGRARRPIAAVIVATVRALKMHGGVARDRPRARRTSRRSRKGMANLARHVEQRAQLRRAGGGRDQPLRAATPRPSTTLVRELCRGARRRGDHLPPLGRGRRRHRGARRARRRLCESARHLDGRGFQLLYPDDMPLWDKMQTIAQQIYGAEEIIADKTIRARFAELQEQGYGHYPVCVAKTQYSFSTDPNLKGAPVAPRRRRSARCGSPTAPSSWSRSAATS